jgi:hypothetical protein
MNLVKQLPMVFNFADLAEQWDREEMKRQKNLWQKNSDIACLNTIFLPQIFFSMGDSPRRGDTDLASTPAALCGR